MMSIGTPQLASSPIKTNAKHQHQHPTDKESSFHVLTLNYQSIRAKHLWLLLEEADPGTIIGCETWLHLGIHERELLSAGYHMVALMPGMQ